MIEFVEQLLLNGLEEGDRHILTCALVLSRQASLEGSHLFPTYDQWLQVSKTTEVINVICFPFFVECVY